MDVTRSDCPPTTDSERDREIARLNDLLRSTFTIGGMVHISDELRATLSPTELSELTFRIQHHDSFHPDADTATPRHDQGIVEGFSRRVRWTIEYRDLEAWRHGVIQPATAPEWAQSTYRVLVAQLCDAVCAGMTTGSSPRLPDRPMRTNAHRSRQPRSGQTVSETIQPRFIRLRDAPRYLGMDRNRFNTEVCPYLTQVPIGVQGIAFDRLELDRWADDHMQRNGRPGLPKGERLWDAKRHRGSSSEAASGTSTRSSQGGAFTAALEQIACPKPNKSSPD